MWQTNNPLLSVTRTDCEFTYLFFHFTSLFYSFHYEKMPQHVEKLRCFSVNCICSFFCNNLSANSLKNIRSFFTQEQEKSCMIIPELRKQGLKTKETHGQLPGRNPMD